ncbi:MAG: hypothetical protein COB60_05660 [Flavobacteriaceae bacterium]|nr:MAG: hypothetical protein COB60_05660 [Flavobacteriaceae bacterium]
MNPTSYNICSFVHRPAILNFKMNSKKLVFKKVKGAVINGIALIITVLVNLPRILAMFSLNIVENVSFNIVSSKDLLVRFVFLFVSSWIILQFNVNWRYNFRHFSSGLKDVGIALIVHVFVYFAVVQSLFAIYPIVVNKELTTPAINLFYFIYVVIFIILFFIANLLRLQIIQRENILENERLKRQNLQSELSALKNQLNPHFLFNSLNSLNFLVKENKEATTFVNKLSFMYRYILQSGQIDSISLKEELKFLESYIYLIKTRYRDKFSITIEIDDRFMDKNIPILALQLLVENAVKHNEISTIHPLTVRVYSEGDHIIVENKIRLRTSFVDSTGSGLGNLDKRYFLLKQQHIIIKNTNQIFKVNLPLN